MKDACSSRCMRLQQRACARRKGPQGYPAFSAALLVRCQGRGQVQKLPIPAQVRGRKQQTVEASALASD